MFRSKEEKKEEKLSKQQPKVKPQKNKEEWNAYMKQYRLNNLDKIKHIEKCKYYKKKNDLAPHLVNDYGIYSAEASKMIKSFKTIVAARPEYRDKLMLEILAKAVDDSSVEEDSLDSDSEIE
jgi:hypothetical protein